SFLWATRLRPRAGGAPEESLSQELFHGGRKPSRSSVSPTPPHENRRARTLDLLRYLGAKSRVRRAAAASLAALAAIARTPTWDTRGDRRPRDPRTRRGALVRAEAD